MKHIILCGLLSLATAFGAHAQQSVPVYLDESKPVEERIEDALSRMTLQEKIRVIHAQSKFSSAGVPRLGFSDFWTDDGPHGVRPDVLWDEWDQAGQTNDSCVAFSALSCLAASWNPQMSRIMKAVADSDGDMTRVERGEDTEEHVVTHSRALLAGVLDELLKHTQELGDAISDAVTADARVGACPKCGKDLVMKTSAKTRGSFIGCMGWPDCDVTYPVPSGVKVSPLEGEAAVCPECGAPRIKCQPFRQKAFEICVNPTCPTNYEPDLKVGECKVCAEAGRHGDLIAHKSEKSGKRFIRCTNYDDCGVSYPLPARGKLEATGETCPECGAPIVVVNTARGPWRICVNMDCPTKEKKPARGRKTTTKASTAKKTTAKKATAAKKTTAKKSAAKKTTAKKTTAKKSTTKKTAADK